MMTGNNQVRISVGGGKFWKTWVREDIGQGSLHARLGLLRVDSSREGREEDDLNKGEKCMHNSRLVNKSVRIEYIYSDLKFPQLNVGGV